MIARYPFLLPHCGRALDGSPLPEFGNDFTELDFIPKGWQDGFGIQICEEIRQALLASGNTKEEGQAALDRYRIYEIRMKNGQLLWEDTGGAEEIIEKYTEISRHTCCGCEKPATRLHVRYKMPYCGSCGPRVANYAPIT